MKERTMEHRKLPVVTIGDAATDKMREADYFNHNWRPYSNTSYLVNDRGQLRLERRKQPRGDVAREKLNEIAD